MLVVDCLLCESKAYLGSETVRGTTFSKYLGIYGYLAKNCLFPQLSVLPHSHGYTTMAEQGTVHKY